MQKFSNYLGENIPVILFAIFLMVFTFLYPPFIATSAVENSKFFRLVFEAGILLVLSIYLIRRGLGPHIAASIVFCVYIINYAINTDGIENVLSHFNKLALLILLSEALRESKTLSVILKKIWVGFWCYLSVMAIVGTVLIVTKLAHPRVLEEYSMTYNYHYFPLIGNYIFKSSSSLLIPRYTGYFIEPIMMGFFFGFNIIASSVLVADERKRKYFVVLNWIGGILTFSVTFFLFSTVFFIILRLAITRIPLHKFFVGGIIALVILISVSDIHHVQKMLGFTSIGDRIAQYISSVEFINLTSIGAFFFGSGVIFFQETIGGGASAGFLDILASRGVILFIIWTYAIYKNVHNVPWLFSYLLLYTLVLNYWHFPFFVLGIAIIGSLESHAMKVIS